MDGQRSGRKVTICFSTVPRLKSDSHFPVWIPTYGHLFMIAWLGTYACMASCTFPKSAHISSQARTDTHTHTHTNTHTRTIVKHKTSIHVIRRCVQDFAFVYAKYTQTHTWTRPCIYIHICIHICTLAQTSIRTMTQDTGSAIHIHPCTYAKIDRQGGIQRQ